MKRKQYGEIFYATRIHLGLTQGALARELEVSQSKLSKLEADRLEPSGSDLLWLARRLLGVDLTVHFDTVLAPARLRIEEAGRTRAHRDGKHRRAPDDRCPVCIGIREQRMGEAPPLRVGPV